MIPWIASSKTSDQKIEEALCGRADEMQLISQIFFTGCGKWFGAKIGYCKIANCSTSHLVAPPKMVQNLIVALDIVTLVAADIIHRTL